MQSPIKNRSYALAMLLMLGGILISSVVLAQGPPPGGGPGDFGGGPPPGGFGGPGGPPPMGGRRQPSVVRLPVEFLETGLKLSAAQKTKIAQIQQTLRRNRPGGQGRPGEPPPQGGGDPNGQPPNPQGMRGSMGQMQAQEQKAIKEIEAILTADQRRQVPALLKEASALREAGLPPVLSGRLALTATQKKKIAELRQDSTNTAPKKIDPKKNSGKFGAAWEASRGSNGGGQGREKVLALLTPEQRKAISAFEQTHPRPQGGFGGPPPDGGEGMPPPGAPGIGVGRGR